MKFNLSQLLDFNKLLRELQIGLSRLDLVQNFESNEVEVTILAGSEHKIAHALDFIPGRYILVGQAGNGLVTKGSTTWDRNFAYLYNNGAVTVNIKVIFFR